MRRCATKNTCALSASSRLSVNAGKSLRKSFCGQRHSGIAREGETERETSDRIRVRDGDRGVGREIVGWWGRVVARAIGCSESTRECMVCTVWAGAQDAFGEGGEAKQRR